MSERREIAPADAFRLLYWQKCSEVIQLKREQLDRDDKEIEDAIKELATRIGMQPGEILEHDDGKYFLVEDVLTKFRKTPLEVLKKPGTAKPAPGPNGRV
jgi:hypothetical protein